FELFVTLSLGGAVLLAADALELASAPWAAGRVTLVNTVPSALSALLGRGAVPDGVEVVALAGEPLPAELVRRAYGAGAGAVYNLYGPTEDTTYSTWAPVGRDEGLPPAIGLPVGGTSAYVVDGAGHAAAWGARGELLLSGAGLARGYLNRPALTAERFIPDPAGADTPGARAYRTGDVCRVRAGGELEYLGRGDQQVKVRGYRIELGEIEAALRGHEAVAGAAVKAWGEGAERRLAAYVTPREGGVAPTAEGLKAGLRERLPEYMVPAAFVFLEKLPLTPNGKVNRRALLEPEWGAAGNAGAVAVGAGVWRTPVEELIAGVWSEVLGVEGVRPGADFFGLGGHSLLATRVVSRLRAATGVEVELRRLFESPTVEGLAAYVEEALRAGGGSALPPIGRAARGGEAAPLSFAQQRLWFLEQFDPEGAAYNLHTALRLRGGLNVAALRQGFDEIIRRHETLRTSFGELNGEPSQRIAAAARLPLSLVDLRGLPAHDAARAVEALAFAETRRRFDLRRAPLLRATLLRLGEAEHVLLLTMHHIVSDGWSIGVIIRELSALYAAYAAGTPSPLAELVVQYADYAVWQRGWLEGETLERQLSFWRERLTGAPPALELPTDRPRPPVQTHRGENVAHGLDAALVRSLKELSRREGATLFMTLLAGFKAVLSRQADQEDVVIGTPAAGRTRAETEGLVGFFVNTLVLRTRVEREGSFRELVRRVRETTLGAYAHQDVPFERLLEALQPPRDLSRTPLFQVFFNMLNFSHASLELPGVSLETLPVSSGRANFDLTLYLEEKDGGLGLELAYDADVFGRARMNELLAQFEQLLRGAAADPDERLDRLSLLTPSSASLLPDPTEPLSDAWHGGVHALFARRAQADPRRTAVVESAGAWGYAELNARANRVAHCLLAGGVGRGDVVAVYAHRGAALVGAVLGVLKAGAAFLILDPAYPPGRLAEYLRIARPRGVVELEEAGELPAALGEFFAEPGCRLSLPAFADAEAWGGLGRFSDEDPAVEVGPDDLAYVSFTSGSTGKPKGILGRHGPLSHFLPWQREFFGLLESDRYSMLSGLSHDPLHRDMFTPLALGATVCVPDPEKIGVAGWLAGWMARERVTIAHLTPAMAQLLTQGAAGADDEGSTKTPLRYAFTVGDVLTKNDVARLRRIAPAVTCVNFYGSTESQRAVGYYVVPDDDAAEGRTKEIIPLGRGMRDVQLLVLNSAGRMCGVGEAGEIYIRSPHLAAGYLGDEELTRAKFVANPFTGAPSDRLYRTGDQGSYTAAGDVEFLGRNDQQVKVRGFRIELGEIEAVLASHPRVQEAVVVARADARVGKRLDAYVVPRPRQTAGADELRAFLKAKLPEYMVPAAFIQLGALPVTPNGKVDRRALPEPDASALALAREYVAPRDATEGKLAEIWASVLGVERVGVDDNFFDLGGHSLLAAQINTRLRDAFGVEVPLRSLFQSPTVARLAESVAAARRRQEEEEELRLLQLVEQFSDEEVSHELLKRAGLESPGP
ncbi:MAG TPA: amino acid adenylation domain-containing protein, partial [Pyrinomonadaceae bacterium]